MKAGLFKTLQISALFLAVPSYADQLTDQLIEHFFGVGDVDLTMIFDSPETPPKRIKLHSDIRVNVHVPKDLTKKWIVSAEDRRGEKPKFLNLKIDGSEEMRQNLSNTLRYLISEDSSGFRGPAPFPTGSVAVMLSAGGARGAELARFESCEKFSGKVNISQKLAEILDSFQVFSKDLKTFVTFYGKAESSEQDGADQPATAPKSMPEGNQNSKHDSEVRPQ